MQLRIKKWFKTYKPFNRESYAVSHGIYCGEFLIFMEEEGEYFNFLSLPNMLIREVPKDDFRKGLENAIIERVEIIPRAYYKFLQKQYFKSKKKSFTLTQKLNSNEKSNNRLKQSPISNLAHKQVS
jgi:hypothetical protein